MSNFSAESGNFKLEILEGLHSGVELTLDNGEYLFGQDTGCDIVLGDEGVAHQHTILRLSDDGASIEAVGGTILVDGVLIAVGYGCRLRMPTELTIGGAVVGLTSQRAQHRGHGGSFADKGGLFSKHPITIGSGVIVSALTVVFISQAMQEPRHEGTNPSIVQGKLDDGQNSAGGAASAIKAMKQKTAMNKADTLKDLTVTDAYEALKKKLSDVGIDTVRLAIDDQTIAAKGRVSDAEAKDWLSVQRWYDNHYSSAALLTVNVDVGPLQGPAPVRLQAIWFGERPYIIPQNGVRYYEGSILESGWVVQRITEDRLLLTKNGETFALTYQ